MLFVSFVIFVPAVRGHAQPAKFDETVARLKSPDAKERLDALRLLREAPYPDAIGPVAPLVSDLDDRVQLAAISAEVRFYLAEGDAKTSIVDAFAGVPFSIYPRQVPAELVTALLRALNDDTRQVRADAAYALGAIGSRLAADSDVTMLLNGLGHRDATTRAAAARACGRLLDAQQATDALIAAMNDKDTDARVAAIWALGELRSERAVTALTDFAAYYGASPLGLASLGALAKIAHPSSAPVFRAALADGNAEVRRLGAEGVARLRDQGALPQIAQGLGPERDPRTQAALLFALNTLGGRQADGLAMLLADPRAFPIARDYLRELGDRAIPALIPQLQHEEPAIRRGVVDVLGVIGGPDTGNTIWTLQQDPDEGVRQATVRALERLRLRGRPRGTQP